MESVHYRGGVAAMKYIRTKDGITTSDKATHELIENICDAGYLKTLEKGAYVRIDKEWFNYYGRWVDLIDENGCHYSIRPSEVEKVTKELPQADTIEELCDYIVYNEYAENGNGKLIFKKISADWVKEQLKNVALDGGGNIKLAILTDKGLIYVAKMNDKGELELL